MKIRTYGWIQNPSSFQSLKKVVQIFDVNSLHYQNLKDNLIETIYNENVKSELKGKLLNNIDKFNYLELVPELLKIKKVRQLNQEKLRLPMR